MTDLVQKIADAVVPMLWIGDDEADSRARVESAIRQSLADASGAVVAYTDGHGMLWLPGERVTMSAKPIPLYAHPAHSAGRVAELEAAIAAYLSAVDESEPVGASDQTRYVLHKKVVNARIAMRKALAADQEKK